MSHPLLSVAATLCYLVAAAFIGLRLFKSKDGWIPQRMLALGIGFLGSALHAWLLWESIFSHAGLNLGFYNALALTSWTVIALLLVSSLTKPVDNLGLILLPVAALTLMLSAIFSDVSFMHPTASWALKIHVLLSMLAYSLLTLAAGQAILLAIQDRHLHRRQPGGFVRTLPPLQTMESLLFEMISAGFVLLTLALLSGFAFLEDMFAQHLVHKTVLSVLAWLLFGGLLIGRFRKGWRGRTAIVWTLGGFALLILAYFGSKAVLELMILQP
ncbi:cytochrome C biogenesis protein [Marichromatium purpuratum 984]|uniref:Cytochrome C biogenesis protein n=1 Tax=Marichromatium purpuratum 984 TaxID=765910 RepID=W0E2D3_MARPU|nr:cytochrome c biogenesis protein CcsA [Marichromatium purpuratum]AHF05030.1 cytochrome C biogenesis protein [Marichromatium purpuratum 984]